MPGTSNPIDLTIIDGVAVSKSAMRAYEKTYVRKTVADVSAVRTGAWVGQVGGLHLLSNLSDYDLDAADTTTADDGVTCIVSADGLRFKLLVASTLIPPILAMIKCVSVADRTALKAVDTTTFTMAAIAESGREGIFIWKAGNFASLVTADTQEGIYIKANAIATSAGAWVRLSTPGVFNVKWFGAKGDFPTTNDATAIQAAINLAGTLAGGDVLFPQGGYRIDTGLTLSVPLVRLVGVGKRYCSLQSTATTISMITISAARCGVENLSIFNQVQPVAAGALIKLASGAVQCTIRDLDMVGGWYCIHGQAGSANVLLTDIVARQAWAGAAVYTQGAGTLIFSACVFDQDWPAGVPASTNDKGARTNSTVYALKDYVTLSGVLLQCSTAGTSAASAPSLTGKFYGQTITDGTAVWKIAGSAAGSAVWIDSDSTFITFKDCDMTGSYIYGAQVTNGLGTQAPDMIRFDKVTIGGVTLHGINCTAGKTICVADCEIQSCVGANAFRSALVFNSGMTGEQLVRGNRFSGSFANGVFDAHALGSALYEGNAIVGMATAAINIQANVTDFQIVGNNLGGSPVWGNNAAGVIVAVGTSDWYVITNNRVHGATAGVTDGGTGTHKTITGNQ